MSKTDDLTLLRRFEPVVRYTRGEKFFPMDVEPYIEACSLWVKRRDEEPVCIVPHGELTLDKLTEPRPEVFGAVHYVQFVDSERASQLAREGFNKPQAPQEKFTAGQGRLARVGYFSRFADAAFSLSLLARGRVPGRTAPAAAVEYQNIMQQAEHYRYNGRVVRQDGWIVLQYWFFFAYNDWRSGFFGVNDHESDWEMVCVYLAESQEGEVTPEWVAYASHDFSGDDLRRRWDDPELEKIGSHPIIYAGAGSHASYYSAGEYLAEIPIPFLAPFTRLAIKAQKVWHETLQQYADEESNGGFSGFRIPFVDYARGDGLSIGPGQDKEWDEPRVITERLDNPPRWVSQYRGLWGLYAQDPFSGEDAPGGPMYNRDGSVRSSWYDPLGWAGLDKVPSPAQERARTRSQQASLKARQAELQQLIAQKGGKLTDLGVAARALRQQPHLENAYATHQEKITTLSQEVNLLRAEFSQNKAVLEALAHHAEGLKKGKRGPLRAHISHAHHPISENERQMGRLAEMWGALSIGLLLIGFIAVWRFFPQHHTPGLVILLAAFIVLEASVRGQLSQLITRVTLGLALLSTLALIVNWFSYATGIGVLVLGAYLISQNLRELFSAKI